MEVLTLWIGSCILSISLETAIEIKLYKDVADAGYKINYSKIAENKNQSEYINQKFSLLMLLMPIYNIIAVLNNLINYINNRDTILFQLNIMNVLEELSEEEKEEYSKNPSGLKAILYSVKANMESTISENINEEKIEEKIDLTNAEHITVTVNNQKNDIYYEIIDNSQDIKILKVTGPAEDLSEFEQKKMVLRAIVSAYLAGIEKYGDEKKYMDTLRNNSSRNSSQDDELDSSIEEQDLFTEKGPSLTKKIK